MTSWKRGAVACLVMALGLAATEAGRARADDRKDLIAAFRKAAEFEKQEKLDEAIAAYKEALQVALRLYGENHKDTATIINNLAMNLADTGRFDQAEADYQRSLRIRRKVLGAEHLETASSLSNLGNLYATWGKYGPAETHYEQALRIREKALPKDHPAIADTLLNLAAVGMIQGRFAQAEARYERCLQIREKAHGAESAPVAQVLDNLAVLEASMGKFDGAERHGLRSLRLWESIAGKESAVVADVLHNVASILADQGKVAEARRNYERSRRIREAIHGQDHLAVAHSLNSLALLETAAGNLDQAEALLRRNIAIWEAKQGKHHPAVGHALHNLGNVNARRGKLDAAEEQYQRSLRIRQTAHGDEHPDVIQALHSLARLSVAAGKFQSALEYQNRARKLARQYLLRELPFLPVHQQLQYLQRDDIPQWQWGLSLARQRRDDESMANHAVEWLANGKAIGIEAQSLGITLERRADAATLARLNDLRAQEAALAMRVVDPGQPNAVTPKRVELLGKRRDLEKQLALAGGAAASLSSAWITLDDLRRAIPDKARFVDIVRLRPEHVANGPQPARYVAWVLGRTGKVSIVDLGPAGAIDNAVAAYQQLINQGRKPIEAVGERIASDDIDRHLSQLAKLVWLPLEPHLKEASPVILSPDGLLWLVPWAALPVAKGRFLIEDRVVQFVVSGRDLTNVRQTGVRRSAPVIVANPDFNVAPKAAPERSQSGDVAERSADIRRLRDVRPLPATASEAKAIAEVFRRSKLIPAVYTDEAATKLAVTSVRSPRILHLATHGFFFSTQEPASMVGPESRSRVALTADRRLFDNPLLRCGLLLAGFNRRHEAGAGQDDGILTGLEIVGIDLRGTELVVLSACDTGLGDVRNGEGVAGLRQAFQLAGAESVVATLWKVPDNETATIMVAFVEHQAQGMHRAEALRLAQLAMIAERRNRVGAAHPFFWAAFTVTGR
jgi:CHAT domain-containing protein/Tfp pilus assembly protein PilF